MKGRFALLALLVKRRPKPELQNICTDVLKFRL